MPIPLAAIAGASAVVGGFSSYMNQQAQTRNNELDRMFSRQMYERQRQDALSDWNMTNAYNSPEQVMQRYKEAGLNPNLIYGGGVGNVSAPIKSPTYSLEKTVAPQLDTRPIQEGLGMFQNAQVQQIQTDNLQLQQDLLKKEMLLKDADIAIKGVDFGNKSLAYKKGQELYETAIEKAKLENQNVQSQIDTREIYSKLQLDKFKLDKLVASTNIAKTIQEMGIAKRMANLDEALKTGQIQEQPTKLRGYELDNLNKEQINQINAYDKQLLERGYSRDSPWYLKNMGLFLEKLINNFKN